MGANATTFVPSYTSGEVLTAANLSVTNSGIPVFATTVTRDAAFGGTGEKTLAEGQFAYVEDSNSTQYYDGAAWQSVGVTPGLVLVKTQPVGSAVSSVAVTDVFSATYTNYRVVVSNVDCSVSDNAIALIFGATTSNYYSATRLFSTAGGTVEVNRSAATSAYLFVSSTNNDMSSSFDVYQPFLNEFTSAAGTSFNFSYTNVFGAFLPTAASHTGFTLTATSGTMTGGTIKVYGYANS